MAEQTKNDYDKEQLSEITKIVGKIVKAAIKKTDDVVAPKSAVPVGTEKTVAQKAAEVKADTTYRATGGARVPDIKNMSADEYKEYYSRRRAADKAAKNDGPTVGGPPKTPPPAAPGAKVVDLNKKRTTFAVSLKAAQNPYAKLANEQVKPENLKTKTTDKVTKTYEVNPPEDKKPDGKSDLKTQTSGEVTSDDTTKSSSQEVKKTKAAAILMKAAKTKLNKINVKPEMSTNLKDVN